ncbi:uncharacterized protein MEPE_06710 [Melanopsichium pennsylvanicum]|uniref:Fork-head domain-containing protein n=2 Tax=Melanopsichium pennsylvanicum TaxID=63383 RepID=A0AAJ4XRM4_9BASI|nr:transcription factor of the forkhead hnf3 family [Melanopsichium pennsylvanicum 4]SNX87999.1 uncharacterized protein MEPE_06710 [Melanopsichium pennsylvanicum]
MLALLQPHSPSVRARSHPYILPYADNSLVASTHPMQGSGANRYSTPPPLRPAPPPHQLGNMSYLPEASQDSLDQRPSPQSRQRSWHHPYIHAPRGAQGLSPPMSLEPGAGPSARPYEFAPQDGPRHRSPSLRAEHLHVATESRPRAASRAENMGSRAQPLNISALPAYPHDVERMGNIGPSRNRGRSSTLTLPHPDTNRVRGSSFIGGRLNSPSHSSHAGYEEPVPPPPRSWEEARLLRDAHPSHAGEPFRAQRHSPSLRPTSRQSPILFAPLSPSQDPQAQLSGRWVSGQMPGKLINAGVIPRPGQYRSRPGTPISPLNMESLSMDETVPPSASGMAVPISQSQQRSPVDARGRNDYFGPSAAEWSRCSKMPVNVSGSPPTGPYAFGARHDQREHSFRASSVMRPDATSPDSEMPRYHNASYPQGEPHMQTSHGPSAAMPPHHTVLNRMEHVERERFAMAQQQAPLNGPQDHGYQTDFAPQARLGPGGLYAGNPAQQAVPVDRIAHSRRRRRPPYSYSSMITQAIASSSEGRMTLREIYTWISTSFSGYPMTGPDSQGWQNTVRHNLSLGKIFIKKARTAQDIYDSCSSGNPSQSQAARGKGGWWTLHPVVLSQIRSGQRTHNDEFDDVERLVEIENAKAAASSGTSACAAITGSAAMVSTSSAASAEDAVVARRLSAEMGSHKPLSRQRSYSDSMDAAAAEQRRSDCGQQSSTAPVSRKGSIGAGRNSTVGRYPYAPYDAHPIERKFGSASSGREHMPSVLQSTSDVADADRANAYNRIRGHTIAMHETPSHHPADKLDREMYSSARNPSGPVSSPRSAFQARPQQVEDVEMESSVARHRDSSLVLQEARETLVSTKQQQQLMQAQRQNGAVTEESAGRMAIRGLLNS